MLLVGRQEGHPACKKTERWGAGVVICLERGADLHMAQLMPLPLTVSSKIQIGFTFLVPAHPGSPGQRAVKRACVCVCTSGKFITLPNRIETFFSPELECSTVVCARVQMWRHAGRCVRRQWWRLRRGGRARYCSDLAVGNKMAASWSFGPLPATAHAAQSLPTIRSPGETEHVALVFEETAICFER